MGQERTFFEAIRTAVGNVEVSPGVKAFGRVWVQPGQTLDLVPLLRIPRFPCAVINEAGFTVNIVNGKVKSGTFTVSIVTCKTRDPLGESALLENSDLGDLLLAALEYSTADCIFRAAGGATTSVARQATLILVGRTYSFVYEMRRP
jgi:hypothetical protein